MGCVQCKSAFEHWQNEQIQIIMGMSKVSSGPLLSIHTKMIIIIDLLLIDHLISVPLTLRYLPLVFRHLNS